MRSEKNPQARFRQRGLRFFFRPEPYLASVWLQRGWNFGPITFEINETIDPN